MLLRQLDGASKRHYGERGVVLGFSVAAQGVESNPAGICRIGILTVG